MKKYTDFRSEQIHINEIGPVGATIAAVTGLIGGAFALKKGLDKYKGYRESQKEKKANKKGFVVDLKVFNQDTGEIETVKKVVRDEKLDNDGVEKYRKKLQKDQDITNAGLEADFIDSGGPERVKREKEKADADEPETTDDADERERDSEGNLKNQKDAQAEFEKSKFKKAPDGWVKDPDDEKKVITKADAEKKASNNKKTNQKKDSKGFVKTSTGSKKVYNSRVLKFGEFIKEDVMKDMRKISKSKKDMEIKLDDGTEIPIDPMTAEIFVKYIEGLKSSEQRKVINQIQRTERGFMKVLGKAHGE